MAFNPLRVALLRAVNVAGRNRIPMAELRALFEESGYAGARTLLQSGNVVFTAPPRHSSVTLERELEAAVQQRFGAAIQVVVRDARAWAEIIARNPLAEAAVSDPSHVLVMCLKTAPSADAKKALQTAVKGPEIVRLDGLQLYAHYPAGVAGSKLTNTVIERALGTPVTARNWNTVLKLAAMMDGIEK